MGIFTKIDYLLFFAALLYTIYQMFNFYVVYKGGDLIWLETKKEKRLFFLSLAYLLTTIFTGITIF